MNQASKSGARRQRRPRQGKPRAPQQAAETTLATATGQFTLLRRPRRPNEVLQAWDAADRYLINTLLESPPPAGARILLVNDQFGALACALSEYHCSSWTDSAVARLATKENCAANHCTEPEFIPMTEQPAGDFDRILFRLPRSHSLLIYQLQRLRSLCSAPSQFLGAALAKYIDRANIDLFAEHLGVARTSLAWKKARLIQLESLNPPGEIDDDSQALILDDCQLTLVNRANVFSRGKLDRGSRLLLSALDQLHPPQRLADLGCGNGLLGISAARRWPEARVYFSDDSYMAVASAEQNWRHNLSSPLAQFAADDCLSYYEGDAFDLILCNPPFHQEQQIGDHIARQMFRHAFDNLKPGGQLCVVGNRHLGYHITLKRLFGKTTVIASDSKFVVLLAER